MAAATGIPFLRTRVHPLPLPPSLQVPDPCLAPCPLLAQGISYSSLLSISWSEEWCGTLLPLLEILGLPQTAKDDSLVKNTWEIGVLIVLAGSCSQLTVGVEMEPKGKGSPLNMYIGPLKSRPAP